MSRSSRIVCALAEAAGSVALVLAALSLAPSTALGATRSTPYSLAVYADPGPTDAPRVLVVVFDGQEAALYEDARLVDRLAAADPRDPYAALWSVRTPPEQAGAEVVAGFLYDEALSEAQVRALQRCHPAPATEVLQCSAETSCACPAPAVEPKRSRRRKDDP